MNSFSNIAHAGHSHDVPEVSVSAPWWTDELTVVCVILVLFVAMILLTTHVVKLKPGTRLILAMIFLLLSGVLTYRVSPALSIVSIALGIVLALTTTLLQLAKPKK